MASLRSATWPSHQRLEKRLDIKSRFGDLRAYRTHLEQMWGFCAVVESQVDRIIRGALADYEARRKLPLLTRDLIAVGVEPLSVASLPRPPLHLAAHDGAAALGCVYVLEGATLGGQVLLPVVEDRLGLTAASGASFLASYGVGVASMWRSFGAAVEASCAAPDARARAVFAATATFDALADWLCGSHA